MDYGGYDGQARFCRTLCDIAEGLEITTNCAENSDMVICTAYASGLFGARVIAVPITGISIRRLNRYSEVVETNWHQIALFNHNGAEYIVDIDSSEKVYPAGRYMEECLLEPDNVMLREIQEP